MVFAPGCQGIEKKLGIDSCSALPDEQGGSVSSALPPHPSPPHVLVLEIGFPHRLLQ